MSQNRKIYCLAFDIERSGATSQYDTIGIGAAVVNQNLELVESLFLPGYFPTGPDSNKFEDRCWNEFWSKNLAQLDALRYSGTLNKKDRQSEMIREFQAFRSKWELKAKSEKAEFYLVSDNPIFDGGFINEMIFEHLPGILPIPYGASDQEYSAFLDTHSQQKGLLMDVCPEFISNWGLSQKITQIFQVPEQILAHDHRPDHDAYTIAWDQQILFAIRDRRVKKHGDIN
jgi:hypothetical protein